jgi:hypothetical protein
MVERARGKSKRPRRGPAERGPSSDSPERSASYIKALERERDRLKAQLQETKERLARLEESRTEVVNRIDWVIDSLHNVLEKGV